MLQRRFWDLNGEAYRVATIEVTVNGQTYLYPSNDGKRVLGALSELTEGNGYARFLLADKKQSYEIEKITKSDWEKAVKDQKDEDQPSEDDDPEIAEFIEKSVKRQVLFRDPSGRILPKDRWYKKEAFWKITRQKLAKALLPQR